MNKALHAGERFIFSDYNTFAVITRGKLEVYAVGESRRDFLIEVDTGGAVFPSLDDFEEIEIEVYAVEDSELEFFNFNEVAEENLRELMLNWFSALVKVEWIELLLLKGDDTLLTWQERTLFDNLPLLETFQDNQGILSMLLGTRLKAADKRFERRLKLRNTNENLLVETGISNLIGEQFTAPVSAGKVEEVTFIVRQVAKALNMPQENINISAELSRKLTKQKLMERLIEKGGMFWRKIELEPDWYKNDSGVLIGEYKNRLAAFIPKNPESYKVVTVEGEFDIDDALAQDLNSNALMCYGGFTLPKMGILDLLKYIIRQCWKIDYKTVLLIGVFSGLIPLVMPIVTETIFADIIPIFDRQGLATVTQVTLITSFTMASLGIVRTIAVMRITTRVDMSAEAALWGRLLRLPTDFFRKFTAGELASRMGGLGVIKGLVSPEFIASVFSLLFSFWSLFLMCYYSLKLTAVAIVVWLVYCVITAFIYRRVLSYQRKLIAANNAEAGRVQQIFAGLGKFKEHGAEKTAYWLWSEVFGETWKWNLALRWQGNYNSIIGSIQPFILNMALYYFAVYGMEQVVNGQTVQGITYAQFIAFSAAFTTFNGTLNGFIPLVGQYFAIQPQLENLKPILEEEPEAYTEKTEAGVLSGAIEFRDVKFSYENGVEVLHGVSFKIRAGENVAIVGKSGSGKSTMVRLLLGFEKAQKGSIFYDSYEMGEVNLPSIRRQLGVVLQNGQLMTGDIFTNIVGTSNLTQDDAWRAAKMAGIADDIAMMPMGMQTVISEGSSNISGGQRQRLLIARALANSPSILIFDEATSALDNRTQAIVTKSLESLKATRIIVAHRLSTIRNCDRIIVMDSGRIVESGTFDELVAKGGIFYTLVQRQMA